MANLEKGAKRTAGAASRVLTKPKRSAESATTAAASALSQRPLKVSAGSERVIKGVSSVHRDALKRLVDR